jgi:hypothetical protein
MVRSLHRAIIVVVLFLGVVPYCDVLLYRIYVISKGLDVEYVQHRDYNPPQAAESYRTIRYCQEVCSTNHTDDTFNSLPTILISWNDPSCVCRCQYNKIYFRELFLAAHFSRKFEKPSDKRFRGFIFSLQTISYHTFHNLPSIIVLYSIYVIMYAHGNQLTWTTDHGPQTTDHRPQTTDTL